MYIDPLAQDRIKIVIKSAGIASEQSDKEQYRYFEMRPQDEAGDYVNKVMESPGEIEDTNEELEDAAMNADGEKFRPVFVSTNAITLSGKAQLIFRFFGEPQEIHENYDFVHCTNHWTSWDNKLTLKPDALESLLTKELRYVGSKYPVCSIIRLRKFISRQWTINAGQLLKIIMQINELDLKDPQVLEEQLTGVDMAYFAEILEKVKEKDPEKINAAYLVEIIDRMF